MVVICGWMEMVDDHPSRSIPYNTASDASSAFALRLRYAPAWARLRRKSDTLEARAKLTSYSALNLSGLLRHFIPFTLHEDW